MIVPIFKPLGASTHQLAKKAGQLYGEKATHTGTLDPMAEGVVLILTGQDRFNKQQHSQVKKTYQFSILFGATTDSYDLLGLINQTSSKTNKLSLAQLKTKLEQIIPQFTGEQQQRIPKFSAKRFKGKSFFDAAKKNQPVPAIQETINIFELSLENLEQVSASKLRKEILGKISLVKGDFRQQEIKDGWQNFFNSTKQEKFPLATLKATTSKRTYIRGLVRDLGTNLEIPATTYSLIRTAHGSHTLKDCLCLI